jgi:hypothetical protein
MEWVNTVDKLGRMKKEFYPFTIGKDGSDLYRSVLYGHDRASRRTVLSDPTFGHKCLDTSGWTNHVEPEDEDDWISDEPQVYRYGTQGNLEATGRVAEIQYLSLYFIPVPVFLYFLTLIVCRSR